METDSEVIGSNTSVSSTLEMNDGVPAVGGIRVYKKRLWILFLFSFLSMLCALTFVQYASMAEVTSCYYGVSQQSVDWTSMIFMVVYLILVFPVSSLINYMDLRWTVLCASCCSTVASATQFATLTPDSFNFVIVSSFFASLANVFALGVPPFLAAKWFPSHELSRACAFGVFGNQFGVALSFIFSPLMLSSDCAEKDLIRLGKRNLAYIQTAVNFITFFLVTFTFQNAPKIPPSLSQSQKRNASPEPYRETVFSMFKNVHFVLVFIMYGLMAGSYFALSTILNDLVLRFFPHQEVAMGWMGFLFIVAGLVGSIIAGYILDWTHMFKETSLGICIASLLSFILFSCLFQLELLWVQFLAIGILGFFLTSFLPIGFEYGLEMTYPLSESVCACLLNASTMIFGLILTEIVSQILDSKGPIYSSVTFCVTLLICCIVTSFISKDYKRSKQASFGNQI